MTIRSMKTAGMALNVGLCNNIGKCKVKKSQLRGLGLWRRLALKSQKYGKPTHNKQGIRKRTRKYSIFHIACCSIAQGAKSQLRTRTAQLKIWSKKKNFKPSLQNGSASNFYSCICVAWRWVASASGCAFLEFGELLHDTLGWLTDIWKKNFL